MVFQRFFTAMIDILHYDGYREKSINQHRHNECAYVYSELIMRSYDLNIWKKTENSICAFQSICYYSFWESLVSANVLLWPTSHMNVQVIKITGAM